MRVTHRERARELDAVLRAAVLTRLAELEDIAAVAGLSLDLAQHMEAALLTAALADVDSASDRLRQLLARLPAEECPAASE